VSSLAIGSRSSAASSAASTAAVAFSAARSLVYGAEAKAILEGSSNRKKIISIMLQDPFKTGHLRVVGPLKDIGYHIPSHYNEKQLVRNALELVDVVFTEEELEALMEEGESDSVLETIGKSIEHTCMEKMLEYEGTSPEVQAQTKGKATNHRATYLAVGTRVQLYKKVLADITGNCDPKSGKLRDRPEISDPGTPPGNSSILNFFGVK
jgi:hypothetical protein